MFKSQRWLYLAGYFFLQLHGSIYQKLLLIVSEIFFVFLLSFEKYWSANSLCKLLALKYIYNS